LYGKQALSRAEVDALLNRDLAAASAGVSKLVAANTTQAQFDAMVSFSYNVGIGNFRTSSILKLHNAGQRNAEFDIEELSQAAKAKASPTTMPIAFARWSNIGGTYELGLFRRRATELMVYDGAQAANAFKTAEAFKG
jgi:lysozyme